MGEISSRGHDSAGENVVGEPSNTAMNLKSILRHCWRRIVTLAGVVWRASQEERGTAIAEYAILGLITVPLIIILFHPDNGFYGTARDQFDLTMELLQFPGP